MFEDGSSRVGRAARIRATFAFKTFATFAVGAAAAMALGQGLGGYPSRDILPQTTSDVNNLIFHNSSLLGTKQTSEGTTFEVALPFTGSYVRKTFSAPDNWSAWDGVLFTVTNNGAYPTSIVYRFDTQNPHGDTAGSQGVLIIMEPGATRTMLFWFDETSSSYYGFRQGMANFQDPYQWLPGTNYGTNLPTVWQWQFWNYDNKAADIVVNRIRLVRKRTSLDKAIDAFGQWAYYSWSGKVAKTSDLTKQASTEQTVLTGESNISGNTGNSKFGNMGATGQWHFGTNSAGNTYFVHPNGNAFWSLGVNGVTWEASSVLDNRAGLYAKLPDTINDADAYAYQQGEEGDWWHTVDFHVANLITKFGQNWRTSFQNLTWQRLNKWGINTIGAFSDGTYCNSNMPFIRLLSTAAFPTRLNVPFAVWGTLPDPFDITFLGWMVKNFTPLIGQFNGQTNFIGVNVDNELSWGPPTTTTGYFQVPTTTLNAAPSQPCKIAFMATLQAEYVTITALNAAWQTNYTSWAALDATNGYGNPNFSSQMVADFRAFLKAYSAQYYGTVHMALIFSGLTGMYLGSRNALPWTPDEIFRAAEPFVDAHSINLYDGNPAWWPYIGSLSKPVLIGEFAFSCVDRSLSTYGMPIEVSTQAERASQLDAYLKRALAIPNVVGAHFFSYVDQPAAGRYFDQQRWNSGLVDIADIPYQNIITEFQTVAPQLYNLHN